MATLSLYELVVIKYHDGSTMAFGLSEDIKPTKEGFVEMYTYEKIDGERCVLSINKDFLVSTTCIPGKQYKTETKITDKVKEDFDEHLNGVRETVGHVY